MTHAKNQRKKAVKLAKRIGVDFDLALKVINGHLSEEHAKKIQDQRINHEPFIILAHVMVDTPTTNPLITLDHQSTDTLANLVCGLFGNECQKKGIAVAVLGQAYAADQTFSEKIADKFSVMTATLVEQHMAEQHMHVFPIGAIPVYYNRRNSHLPEPVLPPVLDPHTEGKSLTLRTICFPCALIGRHRDIEPFLIREGAMNPLAARSQEDPALQKLKNFLASKLPLAEPPSLSIFAPMPEEAVLEEVTAFHNIIRHMQDLENAKNLALSFSTTPVIASSAYYGKKDNVEYVSLAIQRADTLEVLETYLYKTTDFPEGSEEAERFFNDLAFAWGVKEHYIIEGILPTKHCEHCREIMVRYYDPENYVPPPHAHLPEKGH